MKRWNAMEIAKEVPMSMKPSWRPSIIGHYEDEDA
jgi:hypothetical protein